MSRNERFIYFGNENSRQQYSIESRDKTRQPVVSSHTEHDVGLLVDEQLKFSLHAQTVQQRPVTLGIFKRPFSSCSLSTVSKLCKRFNLT